MSETYPIRLAGLCHCGATAQDLTHHQNCISNIEGAYAELAPYWWEGWNNRLTGHTRQSSTAPESHNQAYLMGFTLADELLKRGVKISIHRTRHPKRMTSSERAASLEQALKIAGSMQR